MKEYLDGRFRKFNCPICGKELIRLEPFDKGIYNFWCDTCKIDITIENNDKTEEDDYKKFLVDNNLLTLTEVEQMFKSGE